MAKVLKVSFPEKCSGCELCVAQAQRQLGKVGLEGSLIRILRDKKEDGSLKFSIDLDPTVGQLDLEAIHKICPRGVFTVEETKSEDSHDLTD